ncbi:chaoptin-like, partial [Macrosteles quadrilineatus]|uniref:chaoptin-like n=1 Tax=Macrosteles quadrilineatus TaxID=74068 RepID=UPI0023E28773
MGLEHVMQIGYMIIVVSVLLMVWASMIGATHQVTHHHRDVDYPPCVFNPLCTCSKAVPDLGIVTCRDVPLPRIPPPINSSKVFMLSLDNNGLNYLEPHFLEGTGLYRLEVSRNPIHHIPDEAFIGLERSLWELELTDGYLRSVPSRAFRHLQKLRVLNLKGNEISEINPESWRGLEESLQNLNLAENAIAHLPGSVFSTLQNLETLDLRGNAIMDFDPTVFAGGPPRLIRLILADNQMRHVPYRQVSSLKLLRHLDLSYNMITQLHSTGSSEPEHAGSQLSLDTLHLDYNNIQYLPPGAFQHFNILNQTFLNGNPLALVQTDAFRDARIRELYMVDCGLQEISPSAFSGLEASLQLLDISGNNLTSLPPHLLQFHTEGVNKPFLARIERK